VYDVDGDPRVVASTSAAGGAVAIVSARPDGSRYDLRVWARGNPTALVQVGLPPLGLAPEAGDLVFSGDGKKLLFLVRDKSGTDAIARLVVADLATQMIDVADPIVVGSKGGAVTTITATLGTGMKVTVDGVPMAPSVEVGVRQTLGETHDRISFAVPAMEPGTKLIWVTNALGHQTSGGPVTVMDLGPFVNSPWFVQEQMTDITGTKASPAQVEAGILRLLKDGTAGKFIARLETERGQKTTRAALIRLYRAVFSRPPDTAGLRYWERRMGEGTRLIQVAAMYAGSNEFKTKYGSLTNAQFVDRVYQNVLGRPADPSGRAYWIKKLNAATSRGVLVAQFAQSNEYLRRMQVDVGIIELRLAMLGRTPTEVELAPLRNKPLEDVAWMYLNDPDYQTSP
jgi:hypothetical protein